MKLNNLLLSLSLAGLCLDQASSQLFAQSARSIGDRNVAYVGDRGVASISDRAATPVGDRRPKAFRNNAASLASSDMSLIAPTATGIEDSYVDPGEMYYEHSGHISSGCSTGCDGGCDSCATTKGLLAGLEGSGKTWFSAEALLWFAQPQDTPALVTIAPEGVLPVLGDPQVTTAFGGPDGVENGLLPGFRVEGGVYLDDCQKIGIGGRAYGIFEDSEEYRVASNGETSIGIPFYNINPAILAEDAFLVAFTTPTGDSVSAGGVSARSDLDMLGAEGSLRFLLARTSSSRVDLIGGYTYNRLKNSVGMRILSTNLNSGDLIPNGTVFDINELVATENEFHGGHLGVLSTVTRRGLSLKTLAKVSFGNMRQTAEAQGYTVQSFQGNSTTTPGGIFTSPDNIGVYQQDVFAFIPELGAKLGYQATKNLELTVGYTFMYWSSVGLAGEQIQRVVDPAGTIDPPVSSFVEGSLWMQGIDLGATFTY